MDIHQSTRSYESWLAGQIRVLPADLDEKHARMAADPFSFFRATFYRWMQLWPELCPELAAAPAVLAVGDLHVENFGTWRDSEGRLVWGINDFDETYALAYTTDLVRLATSAWLAIRLNHVSLALADACDAILEGYTTGLEHGGEPFVLSERHVWLREVATGRLRDPVHYWDKLGALPLVKRVPASVLAMLRKAMPEPDLDFRVAHRQAGLGSLGRERYTALAEWRGGMVAREAKTLIPSACGWAAGRPKRKIVYYQEILRRSVRAPDPFLAVGDGWVMRRLSPYCSRIELTQLPREADGQKLLRAMGRETANIHLGTRAAVSAVRGDLKRRKPKWLRESAERLAAATLQDWKEWGTGGGK